LRRDERALLFVDEDASESLFLAEARWGFEAPGFHMYDPPNKAPEPTLTVGPFSFMPSTLESFSVCE
jgi:hypothetical protein